MLAIVFFEYKELSEEEMEKASEEWKKLLDDLPEDIEINTADHAFGTEYNGFFIVHANDFETYLDFWKNLKNKIRWYIQRTRTILGVER